MTGLDLIEVDSPVTGSTGSSLAPGRAQALWRSSQPLASTRRQRRRRIKDRAMTAALAACALIAAVPLVSLLWTTVSHGLARLDPTFFNQSMRGVAGVGGGALHAIWGSVLITLAATALAAPVGLGTALWLVECADRSRSALTSGLARAVRAVVGVTAGIPSIVAGLFVYALIALVAGPGYRSGLAGAIALAVIMTPVVESACEEVLARVPGELREGALALGAPQWRCVTSVILPTARPGVISGVLLGVSRVVGETAPLLLVAGFTDSMNLNLLDGRMASLPVYIYSQWQNKGVQAAAYDARAWTAALVLVALVLALHLTARLSARWATRKEH
ncbi:MAG: phosphate ABC transporter permease PstA [Propionibacteriaceae bacterium]|jgi:phosphate transport system permease protein|nr:phosphate ABC transporter permease PstA [Propionibacteriaceae bacterium]